MYRVYLIVVAVALAVVGSACERTSEHQEPQSPPSKQATKIRAPQTPDEKVPANLPHTPYKAPVPDVVEQTPEEADAPEGSNEPLRSPSGPMCAYSDVGVRFPCPPSPPWRNDEAAQFFARMLMAGSEPEGLPLELVHGWAVGLGERPSAESLCLFSHLKSPGGPSLAQFVNRIIRRPEMTPTEPEGPESLGIGQFGRVTATSMMTGARMFKYVYCIDSSRHYVCLVLMERDNRPYADYFRNTLVPNVSRLP